MDLLQIPFLLAPKFPRVGLVSLHLQLPPAKSRSSRYSLAAAAPVTLCAGTKCAAPLLTVEKAVKVELVAVVYLWKKPVGLSVRH